MAYVDYEKAMKKIQYIVKTYGLSNVISDKIENALNKSTADVVEVKHGKWKQPLHVLYRVNCSLCGYEHYVGAFYQYAMNYCPNCGAKMDGKDNNVPTKYWDDLDYSFLLKNESPYGWIDRNGKYYGCEYEDHDDIAELVLHKTSRQLETEGWIKVYMSFNRGIETYIADKWKHLVTPEQLRTLSEKNLEDTYVYIMAKHFQ